MEPKIRYVWKDKVTGEIKTETFTLDEIQGGPFNVSFREVSPCSNQAYDLISRDVYSTQKDGDNREIYSGDILQHKFGLTYVVQWDEESSGFATNPFCRFTNPFDPSLKTCGSLLKEYALESKIIGTIPENPELLTSRTAEAKAKNEQEGGD